MAVNLSDEVRARYGTVGTDEEYLIQLTNDGSGATAVNTTKLTKAVNDTKTIISMLTGRQFEYVGIQQDELDFQTALACSLIPLVLEAYKARQSPFTDTRMEAYQKLLLTQREMNEVIGPMGNTTVTHENFNPETGNVQPMMADNNFDNVVPGNDSGGRSGARDPRPLD